MQSIYLTLEEIQNQATKRITLPQHMGNPMLESQYKVQQVSLIILTSNFCSRILTQPNNVQLLYRSLSC